MRQRVPYQALELPRVILVFVFLAVAVWYLSWRLGTFNPHALTFSILLYSAEVYGFCTVLMHLFMTWRLSVRELPPAPEGLSVDVFVTTINEPVTILRRTLVNALQMNYPHQTWLLDDGRRKDYGRSRRGWISRHRTGEDILRTGFDPFPAVKALNNASGTKFQRPIIYPPSKYNG